MPGRGGYGSGRRSWRRTFGLVLLLWPLPDTVHAHDYVVTVSGDLQTVAVEARLAAGANRVFAGRGAATLLASAQTCAGLPVAAVGNSLAAAGGCLRYRARLRTTEPARSYQRRTPAFASPEDWLWLPELGPQDVVRLHLRLPPGIRAVLPWRAAGGPGRFELRASPGSGQAVAWFGPLATAALQLGDVALPLAITDAGLDGAVLQPWLLEAASLVAAVGGQFPNRFAQVIVEPGEDSLFGDSPVPFGHVIRSGEEVVRFFVKRDATLQALREDWTAVHEFSHLLLPYVRDEQKWISEGFASYYQNVLLARAGIYSETEAWQRLVRSFASAGRTSRPPSPNAAHTRSFWEVRMLVYWSGAAIALMADVEWRRLSGGRQSLDTALGQLARCCLPSPEVWAGRALFARLDQLAGQPVLVPLYDRHADAAGMPATQALLRSLGVRVVQGKVSLDDRAPLAGIRRQIMQVPHE